MYSPSLLADATPIQPGDVTTPGAGAELVAAPSQSLTLDRSDNHQLCRIERVHPPKHAPEWHDWLQELGFIAGEKVMLMARAQPGGDPLVVRVGSSTFALRCAEAACIEVTLLQQTTAAA